MKNPDWVVWRDDVHRSRWWARVYKDGRSDWISYGYTSSRKAVKAAEERKRLHG